METILHFFRTYPEMAIFLTIGIGFWLGQLKYKSFSLGTVTSVLLVGVVVGQMDIPIPGPVKSVFFLLFHLSFSSCYSFTEVDTNFSKPAISVLYPATASLFLRL